jgi:membrane protein DedA with SNARE-associated domain
MLASSACIPVPSEIVLLVGGWYSATGRLSLVPVILVALAGNLLGSVLAYYLGISFGREALGRYGRYVGIRAREIHKAEGWWDRHGEGATFFSRMIPILRTYISIAAGLAAMPAGRFLTYTVAGIVPWTVGLVAAGYLVKDRWTQIAGYFSVPSVIVLALLALGIAVYYVRRSRGREAEKETA